MDGHLAGDIPPTRSVVFFVKVDIALVEPRIASRPPSKGTDMRTNVATALLVVLLVSLVAIAENPESAKKSESPKTRIALVNLQRIMNGGINYEKIRLLSLDKHTFDALKKINTEIQEVQTQIVDVNDEATLQEMSRRMNFLNQKSMLLRQRVMNGDMNRDVQGLIRQFVIDKYKDKYAVIIQQQHDSGYAERVLFKAPNVEIEDITDDVRDEFQKYMDQADGSAPPAKRSRAVPTK
jgi:hypothetical protein